MKNPRVRGVEVFGLAVPQHAPAKPHDPPTEIVNREQQSSPKPRSDRLVLAAHRQTGLQQHVLRDTELFHPLEERFPLGSEPQTQRVQRVAREPALGQISSRHLAVGRFPQALGIPLGGNGGRRKERLPGIGPSRGPLRNHHADLGGDLPHGGGIVHPEVLHVEGEDIPAFVAHEAVVHLFLRYHGEVPFGPAVERARPAVIRTRALQIDVLAQHVDQIRRVPDLLDELVGNAGHDSNSAMVTPHPPWCGGDAWNEATRLSRSRTADTRSRSAPVPFP